MSWNKCVWLRVEFIVKYNALGDSTAMLTENGPIDALWPLMRALKWNFKIFQSNQSF